MKMARRLAASHLMSGTEPGSVAPAAVRRNQSRCFSLLAITGRASRRRQRPGKDPMKVSDFIVRRLGEWGVRRIYGYPGDGINGVLGAIQRAGTIEFIQ